MCFLRGGSSILILNFCEQRSSIYYGYPRRRKQQGDTYIQTAGIAVKDAGKIKLLHLFLQTTWETGVHAGTAREDNMLVQLGTNVDGGILDCLEKHF